MSELSCPAREILSPGEVPNARGKLNPNFRFLVPQEAEEEKRRLFLETYPHPDRARCFEPRISNKHVGILVDLCKI